MSELNLTQADSGKSFEVHKDDAIVIRLKENPTTGYQWAVEKADDRISTSFSLPEDAKIGGGGTRVFIFKPKTADTAHIQLKHWREWEGDDSIIERFDVTIVVRD
jgi:inhibitor of cysteine peptidase